MSASAPHVPQAALVDADAQLHDAMCGFANDPEGFVLFSYPWPVKGEPGPDGWQRELLQEIGRQVRARAFDGVMPVLPIRIGVSKGHGIGGSALIAWVADWLMSTRRNCHGTVTAGTNDQLDKKTWAAIREWTALCITAHWFEINSQIMYRKGYRATWFCSPASCAEENAQAFAGQHAKDSSSFYLNDEDSEVGDNIHIVEEGGLTDGEPFQLLFGNMIRNTGAFYEAVFGARRDRYTTRVIDSRESKFSNKALIQEWLEDFGEDSDFFRVRVRGLPPTSNALQYIDTDRIRQAQTNAAAVVGGEPLIAGVDVSGGGAAWTVCRFRRGRDARSIPPIRLTGAQTLADDRQLVVSKLADAITTYGVDAMFIDVAYGDVIVDRLRALDYEQVIAVNFGGASPDETCDNMRAHMYKSAKEWLPRGAIPEKDPLLAIDLATPGFHWTQKTNKLVIESKRSIQARGGAPLHDGDALVLTFAQKVAVKQRRAPLPRPLPRSAWG